MKIKKLSDCLEMGRKMLSLAKADEWEEVEILEQEWKARLYDSFEQKGQQQHEEKSNEEIGLIKELLLVNNEIISLGRLRSQFLSKEISTFNTGRKAVRAYQE